MAALAKRIGAYDEAECKSQLDAAAHASSASNLTSGRSQPRASTVATAALSSSASGRIASAG